MIRAPVVNRALDVALRLQLSIQRSTSQLRYLVVRGEAKRNQLTGREISDSASEITRYQSLETSALLETNYSILRSDRHESKEKNCGEQRQRYNYLPASHCTRITRKPNRCNDDVYEEYRQREKMVRGNESPMSSVGLCALRQFQLL